jgi:hypothetical protein
MHSKFQLEIDVSRQVLRPCGCGYLKTAFTETEWDDVAWIQLAQERNQWQ